MKPAYECDFEREDLCGWLHDVNHDFDWRRMQFSTPSGHVGTGPSYDHTKGFGQGGKVFYKQFSAICIQLSGKVRHCSFDFQKIGSWITRLF